MKRKWRGPLIFFVLCCAISVLWAVSDNQRACWAVDFKAVYFGTRCLLEGHNPYHVSELAAVYQAERGHDQQMDAMALQTVSLFVNLPSTFILVVPFTVFPFAPASALWLALSAGGLLLASMLMWRAGGEYASSICMLLVAFLLANCEVMFQVGNTAGLVVGLCVVGAWCLCEEKLALAGAFCLGISLAIKPHDAGLVWLYFLLAGGIFRRRALQALGVATAAGLAGTLWVWRVVPDWISYWRINMASIAASRGLNEPGPNSITSRSPGTVIDLQSAISVLWDSARIYNTIAYSICGALLLVWLMRTVRRRPTRESMWLGLAAVVAPALLITYHRSYDAKLILLTVPACALLWSKRGITGWLALLLSSAAIVFTADIPLTVVVMLRNSLPTGMSGIWGKALAMVCLEPTPLVLLATGVFYLWMYVKHDADALVWARPEQAISGPRAMEPACSAAGATTMAWDRASTEAEV
jgi:hypothetical protein